MSFLPRCDAYVLILFTYILMGQSSFFAISVYVGYILSVMDKAFAIIETGGKQYLVSEGDTVRVEKLSGEHKEGDKVVFDQVLLTDNGSTTQIGEPFLQGAKVSAEIVKVGRAPKVTVIKYKAKSNYFKKRGHRQPFFEVKITKLA
jgi:large subunit ribosomal protein L21